MIHRLAKDFRASLKGPLFWREKKNYMRERERERERESNMRDKKFKVFSIKIFA